MNAHDAPHDDNSAEHHARGERHAREPAKRGRRILYVAGIVAVAVAVLFVLFLRHRHASADSDERDRREAELAKGPEIPIAIAAPAPITRRVVLPGDVRPFRLATVYARVSGYLEELDVDRGDRVTRDQLLGRVTTPETELQLIPLQANLATRRAIADRLRPLVPAGVVSRQDLDRADADVQQAKSEVDRLRALRNFDLIRAPFAGVITNRYVDIGALMPAPTGSTESAQPLVDVADTSIVRVVVYVGQRDATGVRLGDRISISRDDDPLHPIAATVTRIPRELDLRTRTMWVESDIENRSGKLYPGLFVTVALDVPAPNGVVIPSDAISLVKGVPAVAVIRDGRAHFVEIDVADDNGTVARVVKGLAPGDRIAQRISDELVDGGKVRAIDPDQARRGSAARAGSSSGAASGSNQGSGSGDGSGWRFGGGS